MSPQSKIRETKGFVTATRVPDVFEDKSRGAKVFYNKFDKKTGKINPVPKEF
jgi:argonaute-like protein implicated in RNA metabolism and viral defense